jgi:Ca2+-binding RTX toxin-like protein
MAIYGTTGDDSNLKGGSGDDDIYGYAGNDTIDGGDGNDNIYGGAGNDVIDGNLGDDKIDGGTGNDVINGNLGNDTYLFGKGDGQDSLVQGQYANPSVSGFNVLKFKAGVLPSDVTATRGGDNLILSITGTTDSFIVQGFYSDNQAGTNPRNQLQQVTFADDPTNIWALTTLSNKAFVRGTGNDTFNGTLEDDTFDGGAGNDVIDGADGNDTYLFGKGDGRDILLENDIGSRNQAKTSILKFKAGVMPSDVTVTRVGDDVILSITSTSDSFTAKGFFYLNNQGTTIQNRLQQVEFADKTTWNLETLSNKAFVGTANSDSFNGTDKDDIFDGGLGNDQINGNSGTDTYLFGKGDGQDVLLDESMNNSTTIKLNTLKFKAGVMPSEVTVERSGDDLILRITGTNDTFNAQNFFYNNQPGTVSYNKLQLVTFVDDPTNIWDLPTLSNKAFVGTIGNDTFKGTDKNDIFNGGAGNDVIDGNLGNDLYQFGKGDGKDLLVANQSAESSFNPLNILQFKANVLPSEITATRSGNDLILSITGTNDSFTAQRFFLDNTQGSSPYNQLQQVNFADKTTWSLKDLSDKAFVGTVGNDTFKGTTENDTFNGGAGDDVICVFRSKAATNSRRMLPPIPF